jgi:hypothetical protein
LNQLTIAFKTLDLTDDRPEIGFDSEVKALMGTYDRTAKGKLNRNQFIELMLHSLNNVKRQEAFETQMWCPAKGFQVEMDFIPWGWQKTVIDDREVCSRGMTGPFGLQFLSTSFYTSWEVARTRWLSVEGNALPVAKLAGYLAESLLLYAMIASDYVQTQIVCSHLCICVL